MKKKDLKSVFFRKVLLSSPKLFIGDPLFSQLGFPTKPFGNDKLQNELNRIPSKLDPFTPSRFSFFKLAFVFFFSLYFLPSTFYSGYASAPVTTYEDLINAIRQTRKATQERIEQAVNQEKVKEAWETGKLIDKHVLQHQERADYGKQVIVRLSGDLGTSERELYYMLEFAREYPTLQPTSELSWSHYIELLSIKDDNERKEVSEKAIKEKWSRDKLREEIRRRKSKKDPQSALTAPVSLSEVKPGKVNHYRIVKGLKPGQLVMDLGFDTYLDLSPKTVFEEGNIIELISDPETYPDPEVSAPVHTAQTNHLEHRVEATRKDLYTYRAEVTEVVDGDTFHCVIDLGFGIRIRQRVRLRRLDAPELISKEGKEAKKILERIFWGIGDGGQGFVSSSAKHPTPVPIIIKTSKGDDQYGRYLVDVWVNDKNIDQELLDSGVFTIRSEENKK